jgi:hypothetical protein
MGGRDSGTLSLTAFEAIPPAASGLLNVLVSAGVSLPQLTVARAGIGDPSCREGHRGGPSRATWCLSFFSRIFWIASALTSDLWLLVANGVGAMFDIRLLTLLSGRGEKDSRRSRLRSRWGGRRDDRPR